MLSKSPFHAGAPSRNGLVFARRFVGVPRIVPVLAALFCVAVAGCNGNPPGLGGTGTGSGTGGGSSTSAPAKALLPQPADGATGVSANTGLVWGAGRDAVTHRVFLGLSRSSVESATTADQSYQGSLSNVSYTPATPLATGTQYFWRIDEENSAGVTTGDVWTFTTSSGGTGVVAPGVVSSPSPSSGATAVDAGVALSWGGAAGATSYAVYLGTDQSAVTAATMSSLEYQGSEFATTHQPATSLSAGTTYSWRVDAVNSAGVTAGPVWSFTTVAAAPGPIAPAKVSGPTPADGATSVSTAVTLGWGAASGATSYDVYLGSAKPAVQAATPSSSEFLGAATSNSWNPGGSLVSGATYFWRVDSVNGVGSVAGDVWTFFTGSGFSNPYYVSETGSDQNNGGKAAPWRHVQHALDTVPAGATILVRGGTYKERLTIKRSGSAAQGYLTVRNYPGETPRLWGSAAAGGTEKNMVYLEGAKYVKVIGFKIEGAGTVNDASGIRVYGSGDHIEIRDNEVFNIRGSSAMGITVYGKDGAGITNIVIDNNVIHDCEPAESEALVINGNVRNFEVTNNRVIDVNNIGIDVIGGESWLSAKFPDSGLIAGNTVTRANSSYDGSAAGIYSDGASNLVIERNTVTECDFGIEIGAENPGVVTSTVTVRNNVLYRNYKGGLIFGGYDSGRGRVKNCDFVGNTLYKNARPGQKTKQGYSGADNGEIIIQYASNCTLKNNCVLGIDGTSELVGSWGSSSGMKWGNNLWYRSGAGKPSYSTGAGTVYGDPRFVNAAGGDFHLAAGSPAINAGVALANLGAKDIDGDARVAGSAPDVGADERK